MRKLLGSIFMFLFMLSIVGCAVRVDKNDRDRDHHDKDHGEVIVDPDHR